MSSDLLDLGCGLGLSVLVASVLGARVVGMDHQHEALCFAALNARENAVSSPLWLCADWNRPALAAGIFNHARLGQSVRQHPANPQAAHSRRCGSHFHDTAAKTLRKPVPDFPRADNAEHRRQQKGRAAGSVRLKPPAQPLFALLDAFLNSAFLE